MKALLFTLLLVPSCLFAQPPKSVTVGTNTLLFQSSYIHYEKDWLNDSTVVIPNVEAWGAKGELEVHFRKDSTGADNIHHWFWTLNRSQKKNASDKLFAWMKKNYKPYIVYVNREDEIYYKGKNGIRYKLYMDDDMKLTVYHFILPE